MYQMIAWHYYTHF